MTPRNQKMQNSSTALLWRGRTEQWSNQTADLPLVKPKQGLCYLCGWYIFHIKRIKIGIKLRKKLSHLVQNRTFGPTKNFLAFTFHWKGTKKWHQRTSSAPECIYFPLKGVSYETPSACPAPPSLYSVLWRDTKQWFSPIYCSDAFCLDLMKYG